MVAFACYYNVLIASSTDTMAERDRVFHTISDWNGGWGGAPRNVIFVPLMWEIHAVADADARGPQDAINRQLLDRSDFVIAIFKGRVGTPTQDYPGGTIEELARRRGRAAVFFCDADLTVPRGADIDEWYKQQNALRTFRASLTGLSRNYKDPDDLSKKVRDQLEAWEKDLAKERPQTLLAMYPRPWTADRIAKHIDNSLRKISLLVYNTELQGFRSEDDFKETWSCLESRDFIESVVFLIPAYKIERLREYLSKISDTIGPELLQRFSVCQMLEASEHEKWPSRLISSLAFALVRFGPDPAHGPFLPIASLMLLCEPFSSAGSYERGTPDLQWDHKYFVETKDEKLQLNLREFWQAISATSARF